MFSNSGQNSIKVDLFPRPCALSGVQKGRQGGFQRAPLQRKITAK